MDLLQQFWIDFTGSHYYEITIRLFLATLLGGLVGIEREQNNHPAGFRTHILVCVGSTLIMLIYVWL
jgi:putative Mg2+ transporter-C (MgtC) family protein